MKSDSFIEPLCNASISDIENTLFEIIGCDIHSIIKEQRKFSGSEFSRQILMEAKNNPILRSQVKFDTKILPTYMVIDLLRRMRVGEILEKNKLNYTTNLILLKYDIPRKKIIRKYQVLYEDSVWFTVTQEFLLDNIRKLINKV